MVERMAGFQKPVHPAKTKEVGFAFIKTEGAAAQCSCGSVVVHSRAKVREDWIDKHIEKKHGGKGVRL